MPEWRYRVKIKHLFTEEENAEIIRASMKAIHDVLSQEFCFQKFQRLSDFLSITNDENKNDEDQLEYANELLSDLYDYADANRIWIE